VSGWQVAGNSIGGSLDFIVRAYPTEYIVQSILWDTICLTRFAASNPVRASLPLNHESMKLS